ncbi:MAG: peptidylprolyl isomerase [Lachnospiraceae bacterium]|nr:peptidylprolyl isomerase [Lachnospiraceae bacterium]
MFQRKEKEIRQQTRGAVRKLLDFLFCAVLFVILNGCKDDTEIVLTTGFYENEVFRIEGMSCYSPEVMIYLTNIRNQYEDVFGEEIFTQSIDGISIEESIKQTVLARIAKIKMMNLMAEYYEITLDERELELAENAAEEYYQSLSAEEIASMDGATQETVLQLYEEYALANKVYQYLVQGVNQEISDDEARTVTVWQIFLSTTYDRENGERADVSAVEREAIYEQAESICGRIAEGEDFAVLASEYSDVEELVAYYRKGEQEAPLVEAVFQLAEDEVSGIIEGEQGYYIFRCISTYDMEQTEARKREIVKERQQEMFGQIYTMFIGDKRCYLNEELWNAISFTEQASGATSNFFDIYAKYFSAN